MALNTQISNAAVNAQADALAQPPITVYPSMISRACSALDELPVFREMPDSYLRIIARIIKKIDLCRPTKPITASRATLAQESGMSIETVHRAVKWLADNGLIERQKITRPGLRGSSSPLVPTERFLAMLMLADGASAGKPATPFRSGVAPRAGTPVAQPVAPKSDFVTFGSYKIPADLAWLVQEGGLRPTAVLQLMGMSRKKNQRLSDVVSTARKYLDALRGPELYAYLRALIAKDKDYGYQAREIAELQNSEQERAYLREKGEALLGRTFKSRDGRTMVTVEDSGMLVEVRDGQRAARPMRKAFLEAIAAGGLVPSRERVMTLPVDN